MAIGTSCPARIATLDAGAAQDEARRLDEQFPPKSVYFAPISLLVVRSGAMSLLLTASAKVSAEGWKLHSFLPLRFGQSRRGAADAFLGEPEGPGGQAPQQAQCQAGESHDQPVA